MGATWAWHKTEEYQAEEEYETEEAYESTEEYEYQEAYTTSETYIGEEEYTTTETYIGKVATEDIETYTVERQQAYTTQVPRTEYTVRVPVKTTKQIPYTVTVAEP